MRLKLDLENRLPDKIVEKNDLLNTIPLNEKRNDESYPFFPLFLDDITVYPHNSESLPALIAVRGQIAAAISYKSHHYNAF